MLRSKCILVRALGIFLAIAVCLVLVSLLFYPVSGAAVAGEEALALDKAQVRRTLILAGRDGGSYWCKLYDKHPLFERYRLAEAYTFGGSFSAAHGTKTYTFAYAVENGRLALGTISLHLAQAWVVGVAILLLASVLLSSLWYHLVAMRRG